MSTTVSTSPIDRRRVVRSDLHRNRAMCGRHEQVKGRLIGQARGFGHVVGLWTPGEAACPRSNVFNRTITSFLYHYPIISRVEVELLAWLG